PVKTNISEEQRQCEAKCPDPCRIYQYSFKDVDMQSSSNSKQNIEVEFGRPMFNTIEEAWAYTGFNLVSNVGSLASLFLGVSLYQCLTCCCDTNDDDDDDDDDGYDSDEDVHDYAHDHKKTITDGWNGEI
ncbi:unnamed protein product, partial [Meganyctiphanes norvegica]